MNMWKIWIKNTLNKLDLFYNYCVEEKNEKKKKFKHSFFFLTENPANSYNANQNI